MGHSQADKALNHERILDAAAAQIREGGLDSVSVGGLMRRVNLTHGGFYGHFASRADLLAQALERALALGEAQSRAALGGERTRGFAAKVRAYLSRAHRDSRDSGCAIAALAGDVARADEASRAVMQAHIDRFIELIAGDLGPDGEEAAMVAVSAMVGALMLSRVMTDTRRSDALLRAVRDRVIALKPPTD